MSTETLNTPEGQEQVKQAREERTRLIDELRVLILRNPGAELNVKDVITEDILKFSNEELKIVIRNIQYYKRSKSSLLNAKSFLTGCNNLVEYLSDDALTIETAPEDVELQKDIDELVYEYFGDVPVVGRIVMRLGSHLNYKKPKDHGSEKTVEKK